MKTHVIFDLDHTLLDTVAFEENMKRSLGSVGVSSGLYEEAYSAAMFRTPGASDFTVAAFLDEILRRDPSLAEVRNDMSEALGRVLAKSSAFLFPGVGALLESLRPHVDSLTLLSRGNPEWQGAKAELSGIDVMFDHVDFVRERKVDMLDSMLGTHDRTAFVNDNPTENSEVIERYPELTLVHVEGPRGTPTELVPFRVEGIAGITGALSDFLDTPL